VLITTDLRRKIGEERAAILNSAPEPDFPIEECRADIVGCRMRYLRAGAGPPLLLLHGLLGYSFSWRLVMPELAKHSTVYAMDMLGFGFSDRPRNISYNLENTANRLLQFLDIVGVSSCDLLGTSYGGAVVMMAACLAPERFRKLILVDSVNPWSAFGKRRIEWLGHPLVAQIFLKFKRVIWPARRHFLKLLYGDPRRLRSGTLEGYEAALRIPGTIRASLQIVRTWEQDLALLEQSLAALANLPALLIWGEMDGAVDPASATRLAQVFHHSQLIMLPGVGHLPYEESPQEFLRPVVEFLSATRTNEAA
jgi:pimeloyl-ACP methyl ester carboxylesterase